MAILSRSPWPSNDLQITIHCTRGNLKKASALLCKNDYFDTNIFLVKIHFRSISRASQSQNAIFIVFGCLKIHYTRGIRNRDLKVIKRSRSKSVTFINSPQNLESPLYTKINYFIDSMHSIRNHDLKVIWRSRWPWEYHHWISGPKCFKNIYIL